MSRQADVMSDLENVDIMLGSYSRNDLDSQLGERDTEGDLESNGLQTANPISEDFRSLINTNSRKNSEVTIETARLMNNEITSQVTRKLDEVRGDWNTQILEVINSAIAETVLPSIQNVLGVQNTGSNTTRDHQSGRPDRSPEDHFSHMDHRCRTLDKGHGDHSDNTDHWFQGLNRGLRDHSGHAARQSIGLDRGLRACSGQMDHQSSRIDENPWDQYSQVDNRSTRPDKGSKSHIGTLAHRSTRPDNNPGEHFGPQDQQDRSKFNSKFSSHGGLSREYSLDSQASDQDCDRNLPKILWFK